MGNADATHFDTYREQTRVKHQLLTGYLPPYLSILGTNNTNLVYFDGFAGRGHYVNGSTIVPGSPMQAISLIASNPKCKDKVQCFFNEERSDFYNDLSKAVASHPDLAQLAKKPHVINMKFSELMTVLRDHFATDGMTLAPTFLFVDPCGVDDVRMGDLVDMLKRPGCELFLFLNYEGLNRIIGLAEQTGRSPTLLSLLGSQQRHDALLTACQSATPGKGRELVILRHFLEALKVDSGASFALPFRIEHERKRQTSHYLVHATKYAPGFRIMKSVMYKVAKETGSDSCMELLQASDRGEAMIFDPRHIAEAKQSILNELKSGPRSVVLFKTTWVERPADNLSTEEYKEAILEMEAEGLLIVTDDKHVTRPAAKRPKNRKDGSVTLGDTCWVALPR